MLRSCVGCQQRKPPTELQRFQLADDGTLKLVERPLNGRSAWLCRKMSCILLLQKKPQLAQRSLRKRPKPTKDLQDQVKVHLEKVINQLFSHSYRSGRLRFQNKNEAVPKSAICVIKTSEDNTDTQTNDDQKTTIPCFHFPLTWRKKSTVDGHFSKTAIYLGDSNADLLLRYLQEHALMR